MKDLLDSDGENRAVRNFLMFYGGACGINTKSMRYNMTMSGFDGAWPAWANDDMHLTKAGAQLWLRHLFDLEKNIDTSEERVHVSDKNVHVPPTTRALNEVESTMLRGTGLNPDKFVRVTTFNDRPVSIRDMPESFREAVRKGLADGSLQISGSTNAS
jgi:hypothetical protein